MEEKTPLLSIVLVVDRFPHLAMWTLDSIAEQNQSDFEIIIVENGIVQRDMEFIQEHAVGTIKTILTCRTNSISKMMNEGLKQAKGRFVQFLFSGDTYLSKYALQEVKNNLSQRNYPDLLGYATLIRDKDQAPCVLTYPFNLESFNLHYLEKGFLPFKHNSLWFSTQMLKDLKGFDEKIQQREVFELLCRVYLNKKFRKEYENKVIADYEGYKRSTHSLWQYAYETLKIVHRHFGFYRMLKWMFVQDHFRFLKLLFRNLKSSFTRP